MKKLLTLTAGILLLTGGSLIAENLSFSYGINFFRPADSTFATTNGVTTVLEWSFDDDLTFGVVNEQTVLEREGVNGSLSLNGIRITQSVMERVRIGLGFGSASAELLPDINETSSVVDIIAEVTLFSGEGTRVSGSLVALLGARYMNLSNSAIADDLNGSNAGLAVKLGF
ncbi:MAG: hypothetical protein ACQESB_06315 [Elusimicrobiota bacterium]